MSECSYYNLDREVSMLPNFTVIGGQKVAMYLQGNIPKNPEKYCYFGFALNIPVPKGLSFHEIISLQKKDGETNFFGRKADGNWFSLLRDAATQKFCVANRDKTFVHDVVP